MLTNPLALVSFLGGLIGLWQLLLRWRAHRVDDVREVTDFMRTMFGDVIARGEVASSQFMTAEARTSETRLKDVIPQMHDGKLKARLRELLTCWTEAFANAPPRFVGIAWVGDSGPPERWTNDSPERRAQVERQLQAARDGQAAADAVKARCNRLERFIVSP